MIPLSFAQARLWFVDRFEGAGSTYNIPVAITLDGDLDRAALLSAVRDLVGRHESLRTVFPDVDGEPYQRILSLDEAEIALPVVECAQEQLEALTREAALHVFDLTAQTLIRTTLFAVSKQRHVLVIVLHHIVGDGWSSGPLLRDLAQAYEARCAGHAPQWAELPVQYADYALWQRELLGTDQDPDSLISEQLAYWRKTLADLPEQIDLPRDRPRTPDAGPGGAVVHATLPPQIHRELLQLARESGATLFMVMHAALAALLTRLGSGTDIPLGTVVAGRTDDALADLIGFFVNTLVLRADTSGDPTFRQLLDRVREGDLAAFTHQDLPFERLVEELNPARCAAHHPLFQIMLLLNQDNANGPLPFGTLHAAARPLGTATAKFDLQLSATEHHDPLGAATGLDLDLEYATAVFDHPTVDALAHRLTRLLTHAATHPDTPLSTLALLAPDEMHDLVTGWNDNAVELPQAAIHELFQRQAARDPDATALVFGEQRVSYGELNARANRLAHHLATAHRIRRGDTIAIHLDRGIDMVTALLATLKAGAAYTMLDTEFPAARLNTILHTLNPPLTLTTTPWTTDLHHESTTFLDLDRDADKIAARPDTNPTADTITPDDTACIMFTSGSTGVPKGIATSHGAMAGSWLGQQYAEFGPGQVWLQCAPVSWDAFATQLLGPLLSGGTCVLQPGARPDPAAVADLVRGTGATVLDASASLFNHLWDEFPDIFAGLRWALTGGEAASAAHLRAIRQAAPAVRIVNGYGPAESMGFTTAYEIPAGWEETGAATVSIGRAVANKQVYVLDERLQPVAAGAIGELYVAGVGLAHGYVGQFAPTAGRFVACPFGAPGTRMYRTGDLARWTRDGRLEFLGRADDQVKIRGFRVEPEGVAAAISQCPGVADAVVVVHEDRAGDKRLVGYAVPQGTVTLDPVELRRALGGELPAYLVPSAIVVLDCLPLTANGKLDRGALPAPDFAALSSGRAPRTAREEILCGIFAELLGLDAVSVDDDFFALGGHSLLATRLVSRIRAVLGTEVGLRTLFDAPTVAELDRRLGGQSGTRRPALRSAAARPAVVPLSFAQARLWFVDRFEDAGEVYNVPLALELSGELDRAALAAAARDLLERHESLRTVFPDADGEPYQRMVSLGAEAAGGSAPEPTAFDYTAAQCSETELPVLIDAAARRPFDLSTDLPVRFALLTTAPERHVFVIVLHHIVSDGWSTGPLLRDLAQAYEARCAGHAPQWDELPVQYADYTLWQRDLLGDAADPASLISEQLAYWRKTLADLPEQIDLPRDRPPTADSGPGGSAVHTALDADTHQTLLKLSRDCGATVFMVMHAALAALLTRLGSGTDVPLGTVVAGRSDEALDDLIGFFVNTLVLRTDTSGDPTFRELVARVRESDLTAYAHQDLPFERLVEELNPARCAGRHPLFQVMLLLHEAASGAPTPFGPISAAVREVGTDTAKFDLQLAVTERRDAAGHPAGLDLGLEYATAVFDRATVDALAHRLTRLLRDAAAHPDTPINALEILAAQERHELLVGFNDTDTPLPDVGVHELFEAQAARVPQKTALRYRDEQISYGALNARANRLARHLTARGVRRGDVVGIYLDRGIDMVTALLATLKAGAAYTMLDTEFPTPRLNTILQILDTPLVLTDSTWDGRLEHEGTVFLNLDRDADKIAARPDTDPAADTITPDDTACIMFTSGSTGVPKGAMSSHRTIVRTFVGQDFVDFSEEQLWLQSAPVTWDLFVFELFGSLLSGATCVLQPGQRPDPALIAALVKEHGISSLWLSAGLFSVVVDEYPGIFETVRQVATGGEAPSVTHAARVVRDYPQVRLVNGYGPVESMVFSNTHQIDQAAVSGSCVPSGAPMANTRVYVLDPWLNPVPAGVVGELYIAGGGLAYGYVGQHGLSSHRFVACPFGTPGARMYRTGDLARWNASGAIEFIGRADNQVKIRGFRVEPGEVEVVISTLPGVRRAAVLVREDRPGDKRLVGYVVPEQGAVLDPAQVRQGVGAVLPDYLVPSAVVIMEELPLTVNGKLDRRALPAPDYGSRPVGRAPRTPREEILCGIFAELLGLDAVSVDDDFFALGGHSLLATRLVSRVRSVLGVELALRTLFDAPTVAELDRRIGAQDDERRPALRAAAERPERVPLSFAQARLWFVDRFEGPAATYNAPCILSLAGDLDRDALAAALADVVERHESLRTVFPDVDGEPYQRVLSPAEAGIALEVVHCDESGLTARAHEAAQRTFDLAHEPPLRATLLRAAADLHVLVLVMHHIASDGWSTGPLLRDLAQAYEARCAGHAPQWADLPVQYADYALWQRDLLGGGDDPHSVIAAQGAYWRTALADLPEELDLPADRIRPAVPSYRGGLVEFGVDAATCDGLLRIARENRATLFMVLHAALAVLLSRVGAGEDVPVGTPVAGRTDEALDELVGFFVNTLVLRADVSGDPTFRELVARVRERDLAGYAHQDLPFERLVEELNPARSASRHPLFQVMLTLHNNAGFELGMAGLDVGMLPVDTQTAKYDLSWDFAQSLEDGGEQSPARGAGVLRATLEYAADLFDHETAQRLTAWLVRLLQAAVEAPDLPVSRLDLLCEAQRPALLGRCAAGPHADGLESGVVERVRALARTRPDAVAVADDETELDYAGLVGRASAVSRRLAAAGVRRGDAVAVLAGRGAPVVSGVLGILGLGCAYIPIDPNGPAARGAALLADTGARVLLADARHAEPARRLAESAAAVSGHRAEVLVLDEACDPPDGLLPAEGAPDDLAYVIFTSGSTGRPKGAMVTRRGLVNNLLGELAVLGLGAADAVGSTAPLTFDISVWQMLAPVIAGGRVRAVDDETVRDPQALFGLVVAEGLTVLQVVPSLLRTALDDWDARGDGPRSLPLRRLIVTGEALPADLCRRWFARYPHIPLVNGYGPAECSDDVTHAVIHPDTELATARTPIGRPVRGTRLYVLDEHLQPVPFGVRGELYIGGVGVGRGYLGDPARTAGAFVADPFGDGAGDRMYRTGDFVRYRADGQLEFLGRRDHQVKIRGQRIEPGEVEHALRAVEGVRQALVIAVAGPGGHPRLVGYYTGPAEPARARARLAGALPEAMIPSTLVPLPAFPLSANGKLDRKALPAPDLGALAAGRAPRTAPEEILCGIMAGVLGLESVGADDGFFDLGGHSLLATRLVSRVRSLLGVDLSLRALFETPTPAGLAERLGEAGGQHAADVLLPLRASGEAEPLFCLHPVWGLSWCYYELARQIDPGRPVYGIQARGLTRAEKLPQSVDELVDDYLEHIRSVQPQGPYHLLGWSQGGNIAHALAARLRSEGEQVALLALLDAMPSTAWPEADPATRARRIREAALRELAVEIGLLPQVDPDPESVPTPEDLAAHLVATGSPLVLQGGAALAAHVESTVNLTRLFLDHEPGAVDCDAVFFTAQRDAARHGRHFAELWRRHCTGAITEIPVDSSHRDLLRPAPSAAIGRVLNPLLPTTHPREATS